MKNRVRICDIEMFFEYCFDMPWNVDFVVARIVLIKIIFSYTRSSSSDVFSSVFTLYIVFSCNPDVSR